MTGKLDNLLALSEHKVKVGSMLVGYDPSTIAQLCRDLKDAHAALSELTAQVRGECPSLLNEDSGGDGQLSVEIDSILDRLAKWRTP